MSSAAVQAVTVAYAAEKLGCTRQAIEDRLRRRPYALVQPGRRGGPAKLVSLQALAAEPQRPAHTGENARQRWEERLQQALAEAALHRVQVNEQGAEGSLRVWAHDVNFLFNKNVIADLPDDTPDEIVRLMHQAGRRQ